MLSATVLRGCRQLRRRFAMPVAPTLLFRSFYPANPTLRPRVTSNLGPTFAPMKTGGGSTSGVYVPPIPRRLRSMISSANGTLSAARSVDYDWRDGVGQGVALSPTSSASAALGADGYLPYLHQQSSHYARYAYEDYPDDESDRDVEPSSASDKGASTLENVDEWKWKLSMLLRNESEQELVSRERKDRRDFEHLATVADRMGLCSRQYAKVIVFSKVPLPNYRPDLDDKRPQREESPEGVKMLEFRRNLPAYKEKEALLSAISQNQRGWCLYIRGVLNVCQRRRRGKERRKKADARGRRV